MRDDIALQFTARDAIDRFQDLPFEAIDVNWSCFIDHVGVATLQRGRNCFPEMRRNGDGAGLAENVELVLAGSINAAKQLRYHAIGKTQAGGKALVGSGGRQDAAGIDAFQYRALAIGLLQAPLRNRQRVDADIEHRAAGLRHVENAIGRVKIDAEGKTGLHGTNPANRARRQPLPDHRIDRQESGPQRFHQKYLARARQLDQFLGQAGIDGERFFTQHRRSGKQAGVRRVGVERMWGGDVDGLHPIVAQQGIEVLVDGRRLRGCPSLCERVAAIGVAAVHRDQVHARQALHRFAKAIGNPARADHRPAERGVRHA